MQISFWCFQYNDLTFKILAGLLFSKLWYSKKWFAVNVFEGEKRPCQATTTTATISRRASKLSWFPLDLYSCLKYFYPKTRSQGVNCSLKEKTFVRQPRKPHRGLQGSSNVFNRFYRSILFPKIQTFIFSVFIASLEVIYYCKIDSK